jgi:P-type E1-E2 ATPase
MKRTSRNFRIFSGIVFIIFITFWGFFSLYWWKKRGDVKRKTRRRIDSTILGEITGLSESEAQSRFVEGVDNSLSYKPKRTKKDIWRKNIFSIFNLSLIGISGVQLLLGMYLDALASFGVMLLNIGINIFQEFFARHRLKELVFSTRFESTIIRDSQVRSINPNNLVHGDVVAVGPGDQIVVDGTVLSESELLVDESLLTGKSERFRKTKGDAVYAGGYCISGHALFEAQSIGDNRAIYSILNKPKFIEEGLTPLEAIIDRILKVLLVVVAIFTMVLLSIYFRFDLWGFNEIINSAASVIFGIAPAGLFFMILVTYTMGTADIAKIGALVNRARTVESMAQINEVCISKSGILTDLQFDIEIIEGLEQDMNLSKSRVRQILGDFVNSTSSKSNLIKTLSDNLEGNQRNIVEDAPFINVYGYCAIVIDEEDLRGLYALGYPETLEGFLQMKYLEYEGSDELKPAEKGVRRIFSKVSGFLSQSDKKDVQISYKNINTVNGQNLDIENDASNNNADKNFVTRFFNNVKRIVRKEDSDPTEDGETRPAQKPVAELLFAYTPEFDSSNGDGSNPLLGNELIPLARISYKEQVIKEAAKVVETFSEIGIQLKLISMEDNKTSENVKREPEMREFVEEDFGEISGDKLSELDDNLFKSELQNNVFYTRIQPVLLSRIVKTLRSMGRTIAVLGDSVNDVPALLDGNVAISQHTSSQAAMSVSDIVLLKTPPEIIKKVLEKGQRIVRGLLDILKLYITQATYLSLLIVSTLLFARGFPYKSAHGSLIAIITITIPSLGLTLFARPGIIDSSKFGSELRKFIIPAAVTIAFAASVVYNHVYQEYGEIGYAQLSVTYALIFIGLLLVVFVSPPLKILAGGSTYTGAWGPTILSLIMLIVYIFAAPLGITKKFFELEVLYQQSDYLFIGIVVIIWAIILQILWRVIQLINKSEKEI